MSEWTNNILSPSTGLTLAEAAATSGWTPKELLDFSVEGTIKIYVSVPNSHVVFDIDDNTRVLAEATLRTKARSDIISNLDGYEPKERYVDGLFLSKLDCERISKKRVVPHSQSIFLEAWVESAGVIDIISPTTNKKESIHGLGGRPSLLGRRFATYKRSQRHEVSNRFSQAEPSAIEISWDTLRILGNHLKLLPNSISELGNKNIPINSFPDAAKDTKIVEIDTKNKIKGRERDWDSIIEDAMRRAQDKTNGQQVWGELVKMAKQDIPPFPLLDFHPKLGVRYQTGGSHKYITLKNLKRKLTRMKESNKKSDQ